jgi:LCP family protein required for cell wall assembly
MKRQPNFAFLTRFSAFLVAALSLAALATLTMIGHPTSASAQSGDPTPTFTPFSWAPTPVPIVPRGDDDVFNVLLLGIDERSSTEPFRTDTVIILSVNRTAQTVSLLSIPRDTYIWIPGWRWDRINTAYWHGDHSEWPGGGPALLAYTIEYDFGVRIDFHALVDFAGFRQIIDTLDGVDIAVDCQVSGYKLKSPELDEADGDNYEWAEMPVGLYHLDGDWALWYARSRLGTNDWERNRRQQQLLRAIWRQARQIDILPRIPELWSQVMDIMTTDMQLSDALGFVPVALTLDESRIEGHFLGPDQLMFSSTRQGASVLVAREGAIRPVIENMYSPPTQNVLVQASPRIEILNGTPNEDWDQVAAARLTWESLIPTPAGQAESTDYPHTLIYDYTGQTKGSALEVLKRVLNVRDDNITVQPDPDRAVDYRVILGAAYNSCTYNPGVPVPREREED